MVTCKNCTASFEGRFCPNCGQSSAVDRINLSSFLKEAYFSVFQLDRGFFYTLQQLMIKPEVVITSYLDGKRKTYFKPITYVLLLSTIYLLISRLIDHNILLYDFIKGFLLYDAETELAFPGIVDWFVKNFAYANLLLIPVFSLASFVAFLGHKRNFMEHIVINAFITGQQVIFYLIFSLFTVVSEGKFFEIMPVAMSISYVFWVYWHFFRKEIGY